MQKFTQAEQRFIMDCYDNLLKKIRPRFPQNRMAEVQKAFDFANSAHDGVRRQDGTPYIIHPIAVAEIVSDQLGLGITSIVSSLLHDVVEDTEYTSEDIRNIFGEKVAVIVDGLTKLSGDYDDRQAMTLRKMLMTMSDDIRIVLIKIADRLHNMRTLDSMPPHKRLKIAGDTLFLFAPLAHRLGLYALKNELENLSFKHKYPEDYNHLVLQLHNQENHLNYLVNEFIQPIKEKLESEKIECTITHRLKSLFSIHEKMNKKGVILEEIFDLMAIRIVIKPRTDISEKRQCFDVYSLVTDIYTPRPDRFRDWITNPKVNGYESLHGTVMGRGGKWVEVQIRTERMDQIAEYGLAAHYKYKDIEQQENELDKWIEGVREQLRSTDTDSYEFLDEFKLNLFTSEISVFTPKGDIIKLPQGSTVLDLAYEIHSGLGNRCIGAKINQNQKAVAMSHVLQNGDQVEILTLESQKPRPEWLKIVKTAKARSKVKDAFKLEKKRHLDKGREMVEDAMKQNNAPNTANNLKKLIAHFNLNNKDQLYSQVGMGFIELTDLSNVLKKKSENKLIKYWKVTFNRQDEYEAGNTPGLKIDKKKPFMLKEDPESPNYSLATCCNPIPGDSVIGYLGTEDHVIIHKRDCRKVEKFLSSQGEKIITAEWMKFKKLSYLSRLTLNGIDRIGLVMDVTNLISKQHNVNMRSLKFDTRDGIFEGDLFLYVHNKDDLQDLITGLKKIKGILSVSREENLHD
jgi:GTP diphosphokinase / guanosine-3',5'-bis(diphosphate) 3'-diphosphatase